MIKHSLWLTASLPMLAAARNCTVGPISSNEAVGWQPRGYCRGTWSIVSTCLSTIIACTWSIQPLNISAADDNQWRKNKEEDEVDGNNCVVPELILIRAILEFHMAWRALRFMGEKQKPVEWPWWFRNPPLSWLPCCRRYWKDKDLESQGVRSHLKKENWTLAHRTLPNGRFFVCRRRETGSCKRSAVGRGLFVRTPRDHKGSHRRQKQTGWVGQTLCRSSNFTTHPFH